MDPRGFVKPDSVMDTKLLRRLQKANQLADPQPDHHLHVRQAHGHERE